MHLIDYEKGYAAFTRRMNSDPAWHQLGGETPADAPLEVWKVNAGLDFEYKKAPVTFQPEGSDSPLVMPKKNVLYRDDTNKPLGVVSNSYKIVQPEDILEFFRDLIETGGFQMETAGSLMEGRRIWALANTGKNARIKGQDELKAYLLLITSCDMQLATTAMFTSVRVVCNNTLEMSVNRDGSDRIKVPHSRVFDPDDVKKELGLIDTTWDTFIEQSNALADRKVSDDEVRNWLLNVLGDPKKPLEEQPNIRMMKTIYDLFTGEAIGSDLVSSKGTAWGLVNSVTEFIDYHKRAINDSYRVNSAWTGAGAKIKRKAWDVALELVA